MARKKNGGDNNTHTEAAPTASTGGPALEPVKVNNANITELKIACDDAVRRYFSRPDQYRTRNTHTDVRLALGFASVAVATGTGLYGWKTEFEVSKPAVWVGVILYFFLTGIQTAYTYFIEGKTVFVGKRKTIANRIEAERVTVASETIPAPTPSSSPLYSLDLTYVRSSGKTLIKRNHLSKQQKPYVAFFDVEGTLDEVGLIAWLSELGVKLVGDADRS